MNVSGGARGRIAEAKAKAEKESAVRNAIHEMRSSYVRNEAMEMAERSKEMKALAAKCLAQTKAKGGKKTGTRGSKGETEAESVKKKSSPLVVMGSKSGSIPLLTPTKKRQPRQTAKKQPLSLQKPLVTVTTKLEEPEIQPPPQLITNPYRLSSSVSVSDASTLTTSTAPSLKQPSNKSSSSTSSKLSVDSAVCPVYSSVTFKDAVLIDEYDAKAGGYEELDTEAQTRLGYKHAVSAFNKFGVLQGDMTGVPVPKLKELTLDMLKGKAHATLELQYLLSRFCTFLTQLKQPSGLWYKSGSLIQYLSGCKTVLDKKFKRHKLFQDNWYNELRTSLKMRLNTAAMKRGEAVSDKKVAGCRVLCVFAILFLILIF
jgi:hypothetical protein